MRHLLKALKALANTDYLYHVTYYKYLDGIASSGLLPGAGGSIGGTNQSHSTGQVFLTEKGGISYWYSKAEDWAYHYSDDVLEDELVPIVLKVENAFNYDLVEDPVGTQDAGQREAYMTEDSIKPSDLKLWDGTAWVSPSRGVDPAIAIKVNEYEEDGELVQDNYFKSNNPLEPTGG